MDKIRDIDTASNAMTCEGGRCVLQVARKRAATQTGCSPAVIGRGRSCTIGGNFSTNARRHGRLGVWRGREMGWGWKSCWADGRV